MLALSQLDSLLEYPASQLQIENTLPIRAAITNHAATDARIAPKTSAPKEVRSLDQVVQQLSKFTINKVNLMHYLDASDMKLLIFAAGDRVSARATKGVMADLLLPLIQRGSLNKYCTAMNLPVLHASYNVSAPLMRQPSRGLSETQIETHIETQLGINCEASSMQSKAKQHASEPLVAPNAVLPITQPIAQLSSTAPSAPTSLTPKVLFVMGDPAMWAPVCDGTGPCF